MHIVQKESSNGMKKTLNGFTIVEMLIVVSIIGILATIGLVSYNSIQASSRDSQRSSRVAIISEALEKYYSKNGEYPSCAAMTASANTVVTNTLPNLDPEALAAPNATSNSIHPSCSDLTSSSGSNIYAYVPMANNQRYALEYVSESTGQVATKNSRTHNDIMAAPTPPTTYLLSTLAKTGGTVSNGGRYDEGTIQTITATPNQYYTFSSWSGEGCTGTASHSITLNNDMSCTANFTPNTPTAPTISTSRNIPANTVSATASTVTCGVGSEAQYSFSNHSSYDSAIFESYEGYYDPSHWSAWSSWSTSNTYSIAALQGYNYGFMVKARCYNIDMTSPVATSLEASVIFPIATPAAPVMTNPGHFHTGVWYQILWSHSCPANTRVSSNESDGSGYFSSIDWNGTTTTESWGDNNRWTTSVERTVDYYGKYTCETDYWTAYSPTSPKKTLTVYKNQYH